MGIGRHGVTLGNSLHVTAADLDAHTGTTWTEGRRSDTCHILCQCQRGPATEKSEGLTIALVDLHTRHTRIVLGRGEELHPEGGTQVHATFDNFLYDLNVHFSFFCLFEQ